MNNLPTTRADICAYMQPIRPTPVQLGDLSRVNALWEKHQQSGLSVQCGECNRQFPLRKYSTCEQWLRASSTLDSAMKYYIRSVLSPSDEFNSQMLRRFICAVHDIFRVHRTSCPIP